ncbi:hypothetical protein GCM10022402_14030 [Salinactinospora qingdaonensis]|uniref:Secreted peptide n=1 Tax=Salinactinospora qingdaonensis TaxID=702744 RepID=A0ABP7FG90_9ACTN
MRMLIAAHLMGMVMLMAVPMVVFVPMTVAVPMTVVFGGRTALVGGATHRQSRNPCSGVVGTATSGAHVATAPPLMSRAAPYRGQR